ncbi:SRPBCC domain-containing protein [Pseudaminobacter sp. 19-2017]|uniref:SRPBCC domain-containing protein n=1 Tax=Pseudaminobacter soli (ex Zhang et al. 2022) TaxID=2831468 RepID=A0A942E6X1_9HYPH|nr:SRPBCC domain-containing protein [Pseudaminobacter soli]MBS3652435.1 SRPBCC domain-containing protein [Pseudaminobacter soli]
MDQQTGNHAVAQNRPAVERKSDRELVVLRLFGATPHVVFKAWAEPELFRQWWVPKGAGTALLSCEMDVRTGGKYRLEFATGGTDSMAFYGKYLAVKPDERIVWTNEEEDEGAVTTVTLEDYGGKTLLTFHELYPLKEALDEAMAGSAAALPTQLDQLDELLSTINA